MAQDKTGGKKRLSFATKYAHFFHPQDHPPIFDRYAALALATHLGEAESCYSNADYKLYCGAIDELIRLSSIKPEPRELDRYLWLGGMWIHFRKGDSKINQEALRLFRSQDSDLMVAFADLERGQFCY